MKHTLHIITTIAIAGIGTQLRAQETRDELVKKLQGAAGAEQEAPTNGSAPEGKAKFKTRGFKSRGPAADIKTVTRKIRFKSRGIPKNIQVAEKGGAVEVKEVADNGSYAEPRKQNSSAAQQTAQVYEVSYAVDPASQVTRRSILFKVNSTGFADPNSKVEIAKLAAAFKDPALKDHMFVIEGHSSAEGTETRNQQLSQERAIAIVAELVGFGVNSQQLVPVGHGESQANFPDKASEQQLAQDRRVEIFRLEF
ncbi:MAG: outer membrane protein OmpA-like peptidoglycan-associated protein [Verrucomicrobiales bacterium]|jgi:outer membrane protein OmpA-like peptidoglycan-associated protein